MVTAPPGPASQPADTFGLVKRAQSNSTMRRLGYSGTLATAALALALVVAVASALDGLGLGFDRLATSPHQPPGGDYRLGTDSLGRDVWARTLRAAQTSVFTGLLAACCSVSLGAVLGGLAGLRGGYTDRVTLALAQVFAAVPPLLIIVGLGALLWPGIGVAALSIAAVSWVGVYRTTRAETQRLVAQGFVRASTAMGASSLWVLRQHIVPHLGSLLATSFATHLAYAIKAEAVLGYLGLLAPHLPSWGRMLAESASELARGIWWPATAAAVPLTIVVLAAQHLADRLDPSTSHQHRVSPSP